MSQIVLLCLVFLVVLLIVTVFYQKQKTRYLSIIRYYKNRDIFRNIDDRISSLIVSGVNLDKIVLLLDEINEAKSKYLSFEETLTTKTRTEEVAEKHIVEILIKEREKIFGDIIELRMNRVDEYIRKIEKISFLNKDFCTSFLNIIRKEKKLQQILPF